MRDFNIETTDDIDRVLNKIDFEPSCLDMGWRFHKEKVYNSDGTVIGWNVWTTFRRPDTKTGKVGTGPGREWFVKRGTSASGLVKTCFIACRLILDHELMEMFLYDGVKPFDPHHNLVDLAEAAASKREREGSDDRPQP